jgi:signal transduction histidine kinase
MPLRTRLALTFVVFFTLALIVLEISTYFIVRQTLLTSIDNELRLSAEVLQKDFAQSNQSIEAYLRNNKLVLLLNTPSIGNLERTSVFAQVFEINGQLAASSPNLPQTLNLDQSVIQETLNIPGRQLFRTRPIEGLMIRELIVPLRLGNQDIAVLQLARPMAETNRALQVLFWALLGAGIFVLVVAARGSVWLTRAALKPIDQITMTAQSIVRAEDLSRRVPVPEPADELQRLSITVNELLARLEGLFMTQRRFVADVSHELRTPLAAMQGNLDVLSRGAARDPQLLEESLRDMRSEVNRLIRMVNDLLLLAQSEAGIQIRRELVEIDTLILEVHRELRPLAGQVVLRIGHEDQVQILGDRDRIKQALLNLTVNALQHTPAGGSVTLNLRADAQSAYLSVTDTGVGIDPANRPFIFERFYRADRSRSRVAGGAGLGLAIVKWIAEVHGGQISVVSELGVGSTFTLQLPLAHPNYPQLPPPEPEVAATMSNNGEKAVTL